MFQLLITCQTPPVVRYGGRAAVVEASLRTQPVFDHFEILSLTQPIRQAGDPEFSDFLDSIGDDYKHDEVDLGRFRHTQSTSDVVRFVFPDDVVCDPRKCIERAILSPFNAHVDEFNDEILARTPGESTIYYSTDSIEDDDERSLNVADNPLATPDFLNAQRESGNPPHEITLKVGTVVRFLRNFSSKKGVTKNTRAIVRQLHRYSVEVETLPMSIVGQVMPSVCS
jgi:hypothetical protein